MNLFSKRTETNSTNCLCSSRESTVSYRYCSSQITKRAISLISFSKRKEAPYDLAEIPGNENGKGGISWEVKW